MSDRSSGESLHLSRLSIRAFRGIDQLDISGLGRVTLLTGKNGAGKTAVLDAVRIYAARGAYPVLSKVLHSHDEFVTGLDEDGNQVPVTDWRALFHGRDISESPEILIGSLEGAECLKIGAVPLGSLDELEAQYLLRLQPELVNGSSIRAISVTFGGSRYVLPAYFSPAAEARVLTVPRSRRRFVEGQDVDLPPVIQCEVLGPGLLSNPNIAEFWDGIALTDAEAFALDAINLVLEGRTERVAAIGEDAHRYRGGRTMMVKLRDQSHPVPLRSLGDGAVRLFAVALALVSCRNGFLLIDEVDNGLHHSAQLDFWRMVLTAARDNNVQVLATTHGWDCVTKFARAAVGLPDITGALVRIEREDSGVRAIAYSEEELETAAEQDIEVR